MHKLDDKDFKLLGELAKDSSKSIPKVSKELGIDASVAYSRVKRLIRLGYIKGYTIRVNEDLLGWKILAWVGVNAESKKRDNVYTALLSIPEVSSAAEVTGRYDFIIMVKAQNIDNLHQTITNKVGIVDGVTYTETFISLRSSTKSFELLK
ncbi:MAG: Lrp/AsnC family transcriptional regulator [Nitrososphaerota archaeon]|nr:Lrp/AsnC family transcriptional regulator [Nitrososphaerota archaeon]